MRVPGPQRKSYTWRWTAALAGLAVLAVFMAVWMAGEPDQNPARGAGPYTVNSTLDTADALLDGTCDVDLVTAGSQCTLRGALLEAANPPASLDSIGFAIPATDPGCSGGVCTIPVSALGALPALSDTSGTTITGPADYSVVVDGPAAAATDCFSITSNGNTIRNLVINSCTRDGIRISGNSNTVAGNRIGTNAAGTGPVGNGGSGVNIIGTSTGNTVGGTLTTDRNILSGSTAARGVEISGTASVNTIRGNYIGTDVTGSAAALGNSAGGILAGGTAGGNTIRGNVVGSNGGDGIELASPNNTVLGNSIGLGANGIAILGNTGDGIQNTSGNNTIGGTVSGDANIIAHNTDPGAGVPVGVNVTGGSVGIRRNSMFLNEGVGIVNAGGPAPLPVINVGTFSGGVFVVGGSAPPLSAVEVFLTDPAGQEGQTYVTTFTADGAGGWGGTICVNGPVGIVVTATDTTVNNTSAFSTRKDLPSGTCSGPLPGTPTSTPTGGTPTATRTPTVTGSPTVTRTPTVTGTPPTNTPTRTPTVAGMESVTLVGGACNPVASTYAENTPIATIAGAVSPSGILISIWWFNASIDDWQGYSPQFPSVSDLTEVDRLEAIFICVSTAGTWSRPIV